MHLDLDQYCTTFGYRAINCSALAMSRRQLLDCYTAFRHFHSILYSAVCWFGMFSGLISWLTTPMYLLRISACRGVHAGRYDSEWFWTAQTACRHVRGGRCKDATTRSWLPSSCVQLQVLVVWITDYQVYSLIKWLYASHSPYQSAPSTARCACFSASYKSTPVKNHCFGIRLYSLKHRCAMGYTL